MIYSKNSISVMLFVSLNCIVLSFFQIIEEQFNSNFKYL